MGVKTEHGSAIDYAVADLATLSNAVPFDGDKYALRVLVQARAVSAAVLGRHFPTRTRSCGAARKRFRVVKLARR